MSMDQQIMRQIFPAGIVYSDRHRVRGGAYARLAFLPFDTLELEFATNCPEMLCQQIEDDAAAIQAQIGQEFKAAGQSVVLGWAKLAPTVISKQRLSAW